MNARSDWARKSTAANMARQSHAATYVALPSKVFWKGTTVCFVTPNCSGFPTWMLPLMDATSSGWNADSRFACTGLTLGNSMADRALRSRVTTDSLPNCSRSMPAQGWLVSRAVSTVQIWSVFAPLDRA